MFINFATNANRAQNLAEIRNQANGKLCKYLDTSREILILNKLKHACKYDV